MTPAERLRAICDAHPEAKSVGVSRADLDILLDYAAFASAELVIARRAFVPEPKRAPKKLPTVRSE